MNLTENNIATENIEKLLLQGLLLASSAFLYSYHNHISVKHLAFRYKISLWILFFYYCMFILQSEKINQIKNKNL